MHRELALRRTERDLQTLWQLALAGRADVRALRAAAQSPDLTPQQRDEMLAFANALDGAKERQVVLAKQIARTVGTYAETPITTVVSDSHDAANDTPSFSGGRLVPPPANPNPNPNPTLFQTDTMVDAVAAGERAQSLFQTFSAEYYIKRDLADASTHATAAMKLGGCSNPGPSPAAYASSASRTSSRPGGNST